MTEPTPRDKVRTHTKALGEASYMLEHLADSLARRDALLQECRQYVATDLLNRIKRELEKK